MYQTHLKILRAFSERAKRIILRRVQQILYARVLDEWRIYKQGVIKSRPRTEHRNVPRRDNIRINGEGQAHCKRATKSVANLGGCAGEKNSTTRHCSSTFTPSRCESSTFVPQLCRTNQDNHRGAIRRGHRVRDLRVVQKVQNGQRLL